MKKTALLIIALLIFGLVCSCNSNNKNDSHQSFELSNEGNKFYRFFEMDGTSSDGHDYKLNVVYGYSINLDIELISLDRRKANRLNSFVTENVAAHVKFSLSSKLHQEILELKNLNSDLEDNIIENLNILNDIIEEQDLEVIKLDITMRN